MKRLLALVLAGSLAACATVTHGTGQQIEIIASPAASCELSNAEGSWRLAAPGSIRVTRSKSDLSIVCSRPGFQDAVVRQSPWYQNEGNEFVGGLIGIAIDAATGANYYYNDQIEITLKPLPAGIASR